MREIARDAYCIAVIRSSITFSSGVSCELYVFIFNLSCPCVYSNNPFVAAFGSIQSKLIKHKIAHLDYLQCEQFEANVPNRKFSVNIITAHSLKSNEKFIFALREPVPKLLYSLSQFAWALFVTICMCTTNMLTFKCADRVKAHRNTLGQTVYIITKCADVNICVQCPNFHEM